MSVHRFILSTPFRSQRFFSSTTKAFKKQPKEPRYSVQNQQVLDDYMIPGPALRFFKTKRTKKPQETTTHPLSEHGLENMYTAPARSIRYNEFDSAPTVVQERLAERIHRAITTMYSVEALPTQWITPQHVLIRAVKVSRNLRKCRVLYEALSDRKQERGHTHRSLSDYTPLLNTLIHSHANIKHPLSIKFIPDTQTKELDDIFKQILSEQDKGNEINN
ncbi:hypothetical protein EDC96DRAFT_95052 [Choanephora cucurbitarum]|nr:hypothetical protein EDC96DRAFT_95052 [Choanephora cucurbitarum]